MIWLIGCKGMLGSEIARQLNANKINWVGSDKEVDITNIEALDNFTESHDTAANRTGSTVAKGNLPSKITWIINCAGYTDVDKAEEEADIAKKINEDGARNIARAARHIGAKLIHISADYVFDGNADCPYTEESEKNPINTYGATKAAGEDAVQKEMTQYYIVRTAWLFGFKGKNFVHSITEQANTKESIRVVNDQKGCPTSAVDLASVIIKIIMTSVNAHKLFGKNSALPYGIYQFTNSGETTWYDFAKKIYDCGKKYKRITQDCAINPCTSEEYQSIAKRPRYSVLCKDKIQKALKIKIPSWEDSLEKFIKSENFTGV